MNIPDLIRVAGNYIRTSTISAFDNNDLAFDVYDPTKIENEGGLLEVEYDIPHKREVIYVLSKSGNTLTIADDGRGLYGTNAQDHPANSKVRDFFVDDHINQFVNGFTTGWFDVIETWTYASANTITVPAGAASRYAVGGRISIVQSSNIKYLNVVGVADELLTVSGGSDYSVANSAISNIKYSSAISPVGFPKMFNFATSPTGFSGTPTANSWFTLHGYDLHFWGIIQGTSNATNMYTTLPVNAAAYYSHPTSINHDWEGALGYLANNNVDVTTAARWRINLDQLGRLYFYTNMVKGAFASSNTKGAQWDIWYQI